MQVDLQRRPEQQKKLVGKCQLEYAEKKNPEKCRIDAYNATFPSCFTISQVLILSPMKEKNIYKQHIDRRALNIWFVFFSFLFWLEILIARNQNCFHSRICDAEPWFYHVILQVELSAKDRKKNSLANRRILGQNVQDTRTTTRRTDVKPIQ